MRSIKYLHLAIPALALSALCFVFSAASFAQEKQIERVVTFGTSLSDSGNAFTILSDSSLFGFSEACNLGIPANTPPYDSLDDFFIPDGSYAKGGHHVSNGATWIEQFALGSDLAGNTQPSLRGKGIQASNYAVGGARSSDFDCRFNLSDQLSVYLSDFPETSAHTLVVIEMGSNDVRDALAKLAEGEDPATIISTALLNIGNTIQVLYGHGARKFLLVNVPAVGETPAVKILDTLFPGSAFAANNLTQAFNSGLVNLHDILNLSLPDVDIRILNLYSLLYEIIETPDSFGIINTEDACVTPNIPPFQCKKPDTYIFWDGVHPTKVVHGIIAQKAKAVLLTP